MNYIYQIRGFYDSMLTNRLSTGQIALWHALMTINNKCAWAEWFSAPNSTLELLTDLSRKGIYNARNTLKQLGYIDFESNGIRATKYKINKLYDNTWVQDITQHSTQGATQPTTQGTTQGSATLNKHKQNKTKQPPISPKGEEVVKRFEQFWSAYPRKVGKGLAEKWFIKNKPSEQTLVRMIEAVETQKTSEQWLRQNGQFIPYPATWLNQERWRDTVDITTQAAPSLGDRNEKGQVFDGERWVWD